MLATTSKGGGTYQLLISFYKRNLHHRKQRTCCAIGAVDLGTAAPAAAAAAATAAAAAAAAAGAGAVTAPAATGAPAAGTAATTGKTGVAA